MAIPTRSRKDSPRSAPHAEKSAVDVAQMLPGAPRGRGGSNAVYTRVYTIMVTDDMYDAIKAEVARREKNGEPRDVASMGAVTREALIAKLGVTS